MEFKKVLFSIVIVSMVMIAAGTLITEWAPKYNSSITDDLSDDFDNLDALQGEADTYKGNINPQSGEASSDYEAETFRGGYGIVTNIFPSLRTVYGQGGMFDVVAERWGVPTYVVQGLTIMFVFAIVFGIVAIVFRLGRTSG